MSEPKTFGDYTKAFFDPILDIVTLPRMAQGCGRWESHNDNPEECCFGARIEHGITKNHSCSHVSGMDRMFNYYDELVVHGQHLDKDVIQDLFWLCGANWAPFSAGNWHWSVKTVMRNLYKIEHFSKDILNAFISEVYDRGVPGKIAELNKVRRKYLKQMWAYRYE